VTIFSYTRHTAVVLISLLSLMSPELLESDIRRVVQNRIREGTLPVTKQTVPIGERAGDGTPCVVCGLANLSRLAGTNVQCRGFTRTNAAP
jgi:hypothetical protein